MESGNEFEREERHITTATEFGCVVGETQRETCACDGATRAEPEIKQLTPKTVFHGRSQGLDSHAMLNVAIQYSTCST